MNSFFGTSITKNYTIFLAVVASLLFLSVYAQFAGADISAEKELTFWSAKAWLQGKKFYLDIFTVQPPLIYYIYAAPVYLSMHVGILEDYHYMTLLGLIAIAYVTFITLQIIRFHPEFTHNRKKQAEFCLLIISALITFQNPQYFLDREHLFFVLTLPYLLRFMPSIAKAPLPKHLSIITGILAGIGFCFKPHCLILFAGIQCVYVLRERSLAILKSTENIIIYLTGVFYIACVFVFTPEYITVVMPMAFATYAAIKREMGGLLFGCYALLPFTMTFADFRLRYTSPYRKDIFYLLSTALFFGVYAIAGSGWGYTWNLLATMGFMLNGFVLWEYFYLKKEHEAKNLPVRQFVFGIRACMICFCYHAVLIIAVDTPLTFDICGTMLNCVSESQFIDEAEAVNGGQKITSFGTISIDFATWPLLERYTGAQWDTRFNHLWMLPKFFISDAAFAEKHQWITDYVSNAYAQDLHNNKPQLVFVDDTDKFYTVRKSVDLIAFLASSPAFTREWKNYRYIGKMDGLDTKEKQKQASWVLCV